MKKLVVVSFMALCFFGCDREPEVLTSFPFEVNLEFNTEMTVNVEDRISLSISPEQVVTTNEYIVSYRLLSGDVLLRLPDGTTFSEAESVSLDNFSLELTAVSSQVGEIELEMTIDDQQGESETTRLNISTVNNPFDFEISALRSDATVNAENSFSVNLTNLGEDTDVSYTAVFSISQGQGEITRRINDNEFSQITQGEEVTIDLGTSNYGVVFTNDGSNIVSVTVTDSNGQDASKTFSFDVSTIDFNFTATPARNETNLGVDVPITFLINETDGGDDTYQLRYVIASGDADVFDNTTQVIAGTNISAPLSEEFNLLFRPTQTGLVSLNFFIRNESGEERQQTVSIDVLDRSFDYTVTPSLTSLAISEPLTVTYVITEEGGATLDSYSMIFSATGNATMTVNSVEYSAGETIPIPSLSFQAIYNAATDGEHTVTSVITAASNNREIEKDFDVFIEASDFEFSVSSPSEVTVGETIDLEFNINELVGNSDFDASYAITGVNAEFRNENNVLLSQNTDFDVNNTFIWSITGTQQGSMNIVFTVENQFGVVKTQSVTIEVLPISFDFMANLTNTTFKLGEGIGLNFIMDAPDTLTYELSFTANTGGSIDTPSERITVGETSTVPNTNFSAQYLPAESGSSVLNLTITASNGFTVTRTLNFEISQNPVITSAVAAPTQSCGPAGFRFDYFLTWTKSPNVSIVSYIVISGFNNTVKTGTFSPPITGDNNTDQLIFQDCTNTRNFDVVIIDSDGNQSEPFRVIF